MAPPRRAGKPRPSLAAALAGAISKGSDPMLPDDANPQNPATLMEDAAAEAVNAAGSATAETANRLEGAASTAADAAQSATRQANEAAVSATRAGADAFGEARERLNAMADSLPRPAQDMLRPFQAGGDALGKGLGASYVTAMEGMAEFNSKAVAAWRSNAEATIRHWQGLASVKSLSEAIALNAEHTRQQLETVAGQTRELSALATRIVRDAANPLKLTGR